ncbi:unnamed protein product, partial [marine sediment metagenome]
TGKSFLQGLEEEEKTKEAEKIRDKLLDRYGEMLIEAAGDPLYFKANIEIISSIYNTFSELMLGKTKSLLMGAIKKLYKESDWEETIEGMLIKGGADVVRQTSGRARLLKPMGVKGKIAEDKIIKTSDQVDELIRNLEIKEGEKVRPASLDEIKELYSSTKYKKLLSVNLREAVYKLFETRRFETGVQMPLKMAWGARQQQGKKTRGGMWEAIRPDIFFTVPEKNIKKLIKTMEILFRNKEQLETLEKYLRDQIKLS